MTTANTTTNTSIDNNEATVEQYLIGNISREFKNGMNQDQELLKNISENNITLESANAIASLLTSNIVFANKTGKNKKRRTQLELAQDHVKDVCQQINSCKNKIEKNEEKLKTFKNKNCSSAQSCELRVNQYTGRLNDLYKELEISKECLEEIEQA